MRVSAAIVAATLLAGCASTTTLPPRKLARGELVAQLAFDEPGVLYIPRVSGQLTLGFGRGDASAHVGTTVRNVDAGGAVRWYVGAHSAVSLQADATFTPEWDTIEPHGMFWAAARFGRVLSSASDHLYGGAQLVGLLIVPVYHPRLLEPRILPDAPAMAPGGYIGYAIHGERISSSFELSVLGPVALARDVNALRRATVASIIAPQFSIGFQFHRARGDVDE